MNRVFVLAFAALVAPPLPSWAGPAAGGNGGGPAVMETLAKLESLLPDRPAIATREAVELMTAAAQTGRLDAARLLIRGLAFNHDPDSSNETRSLPEMIPAVVLLERHYGEDVVPLLVFAGATTEQAWLRPRIALAIREIAGRERLAALAGTFGLRHSESAGARALAALLAADTIEVELFSPAAAAAEEVLRRLQKPPGGR